MGERFPAPEATALSGIHDPALYDVSSKIVLPYGPEEKGHLLYYPDAHFLHAEWDTTVVPSYKIEHVSYNLRTRRGYCEKGNKDEYWANRVAEALPVLEASGIDLSNIPQGYPEVDDLISVCTQDSNRVAPEDLARISPGAWFIGRSATEGRWGDVFEYTVFEYDSIKADTNFGNQEIWRLYARPFGQPTGGEMSPHSLHLGESTPQGIHHDMHEGGHSSYWHFVNGSVQFLRHPENVVLDRFERPPPDMRVFHLSNGISSDLIKLRIPASHRINDQPYEREHYALSAALDGMQYSRHEQTRNPAAYAYALRTLADRFGEAFFRETVWHKIEDHLQQIQTQEFAGARCSEVIQPHAVLPEFPHRWMGIVRTLIDRTVELPNVPYADQNRYYNEPKVRPLFGDEDFWKTLNDHLPDTFSILSQRWADLPEERVIRLRRDEAIVNPRVLLQRHFPEAYAYLTGQNRRCEARVGAVAVRIVETTSA